MRAARWTATVADHSPSRRRALQALQDVQVGGEVVEAPLLVERVGQALEIAARIVHVRLRDLDVVQPDRRIDGVVPRLGALAHDLFVDLALGRTSMTTSPRMWAEQPSRRPSARPRRVA